MDDSESEGSLLADERDEEVEDRRFLCCKRQPSGFVSIQSGDIELTPPGQEDEEDSRKETHGGLSRFRENLHRKFHLAVHRVVNIFFANFIPPVVTLLVFLVLIPVGLACLAYFVYPPQLDLSLRSFQIPNHESSLNYDAYQMALHPHVTENDQQTRRKRGAAYCPGYQNVLSSAWMMDLFYISKDGKNILTEDRLAQIHNIEKYIVQQHKFGNQGYKDFCHMTHDDVCDPLNSLLTFFYPSYSQSSSKWIYDGNGDTIEPIKEALALAFQSESSYWYVDSKFTIDKMESKLLRSQLRVGVPLVGLCGQHDAEHQRVTDYFLSFVSYLDEASTSDIEVLYGGTEIFDHEVEEAINHDQLLAIVSLALVAPLVFILSGFSLFSTITAMFTLASCFPLAFFCYRVVFGIKAVGLLNVVSVFVIIGIGVDDVFVFLNTFKQTSDLEGIKTIQDRLAYTIIHASKATFLTSATTAVAFFSNTLSAIPAVHQFGLFMGLVVLFCYLQVTLIMPSFLYLWQRFFSRFEYLYFVCCLWNRNRSLDSDSTDSSEQGSTDSGIVVMSHLIEREHSMDNDDAYDDVDMLSLDAGSVGITELRAVTTRGISDRIETGMKKMTVAVQKFVLKFISRPITYVRVPLLIVFAILLVASVITSSFLRPTHQAPQFLDSNSNIQKLLDLQNEVSQQSDYDCWNCSAFFIMQATDGTLPTGTLPTGGPTGVLPHPSSSSTPSSSSSSNGHHNTGSATSSASHIKPSSTAAGKTTSSSKISTTADHVKPTTTTTSKSTHSTSSTSSTTRHTQPTQPTRSSTTTSSSGHQSTSGPTATPPTLPPSTCSGDNYDKCIDNQADKPAFSGSAVVYVVFGISGIIRTFSPSHVIAQENDLGITQFDKSFQKGFPICQSNHPTSPSPGLVKALCRICKNITNSKLVQKNGANCFPLNVTTLGCPGGTSSLFDSSTLSECQGVSTNGIVTVNPVAHRTGSDSNGDDNMLFIAMAFKSTTDTNKSPFDGYSDYLNWNNMIDSELAAIKGNTKEYGDAYQALKSAYHTSDYWVVVNTEVIAVYGAIYGILISFLLCVVLITILSRNWRILVSMFSTIIGILFLLMACFKAFGWTLGIVEAVTLSIIVGNSLDYCIHLTQAYLDVDHRHLALVERLGFTWLGIRSQKVMAGMAYIGVSIISSAITTFLATLPLLATEIQLFKKFGEILVLDTAIAILYTVLFCSSMLTFIGPKRGNSAFKYQLITMVTPLFVILVLVLVLFIVSKCGVDIPSPLGGYLFQ